MEKGYTIRVLDHGYVKFIDSMGSDEAIVEAARMSTGRGFVSWGPYQRCRRCDRIEVTAHVLPGGFGHLTCLDEPCHDWQDFPRGDHGTLEHMYRERHSTPFEFGELHIEVQAPIMVFREWHRHRTQSYSEFSARYSQMPNLHYVPELGRIQKQSLTNRQGSGEAVGEELARAVVSNLVEEQQAIYDHYEGMCSDGIAKEVARLNTPVSRYSKMRAKTDLWNWLAFLRLRTAPAAQWEIRQCAIAVEEMVKAIWPKTHALYIEFDRDAVRLSASEAKILRAYLGDKRGWLGGDDEHDRANVASIKKKLGCD